MVNPDAASDRSASAEPRPELRSRLARASWDQATALLREFLQAQLAELMGWTEGSQVAPDRSLLGLGIDSLRAVDLKLAIEAALDCALRSSLVFDHPTIDGLARYLAGDVLGLAPAADHGGDAPARRDAAAPDRPAIDAMSEHQLLAVLRESTARLHALGQARCEPIAVVGIGCRFPGGVASADEFWQLQLAAVDAITEVPPDRWDGAALYAPDPAAPGKMITRHGGFLGDLSQLDAAFFGISAREAASMDPQQRLLLECAWEAIEHAGQSPRELSGAPVGVFVGCRPSEYAWSRLGRATHDLGPYFAAGDALSMTAGRLSYVLGLTGPSMALDTACSASLVAVHLACEAIRRGECRAALAGGANVLLLASGSIALSKAGMLSPDGRCKTFAAAANGYARAEGCGVVYLKRLSDAARDGDRVLAVVRGSAVNQDGASAGLTVPSGPAQEAVIRRALEVAGVEPADVGYVEAHGTGTPLGDPIELHALGAVFGAGRSTSQPLLVGSVKTNIGHAETAAGIAGFIKCVMAIHHRAIPAHLHFDAPNPYVSWSELPFHVPTETTPWPHRGGARIAGVSSFGFSGTNCHVVLAEAPPAERAEPAPLGDRTVHLLAISAYGAPALSELAARHRDRVRAGASGLADVCFSANVGRAHLPYRAALTFRTRRELIEQLGALARGDTPAGAILGPPPAHPGGALRVAFLFPGQGCQYAGMAQALYATEPVFRRAIDRADAVLRSLGAAPLPSILWGDHAARIDETRHAQPALFAVEYALVELWASWGVAPQLVIGHSVGEYVAAAVAGVFSVEHGLELVAARGHLMHERTPPGAMAVVHAPAREVSAHVAPYADRAAIAAVNGPASVVVSGDPAAVAAIVEPFVARGTAVRRLEVQRAFHSPLMAPVLAPFGELASGIALRRPTLPLISNLTGQPAGDEIASPAYWVRHVSEPVQFAAGAAALGAEEPDVLIEIGPTPTLIAMARPLLSGARDALWLASLVRGKDDTQQLLGALGALYARGANIDWAGFDRDRGRRKVDVPFYPFQRQRYWLADPALGDRAEPPPVAPLREGDRASQGWLHRVEWRRCPADGAITASRGTWLIVGGAAGSGGRVGRALEAAGAHVVHARLADGLAGDVPTPPELAGSPERFAAWLDTAGPAPLRGVVLLAAPDAPDALAPAAGDAALFERGLDLVGVALRLVQAAARRAAAPALWLITRGAQPVPRPSQPDGSPEVGPIDPAGLAQAPLWGLGRTVQSEHPELTCRLVDLDPGGEPGPDLDALVARLLAPDREDQLALRGGEWFAARLVRAPAGPAPAPGTPALRPDRGYLITGGLGGLGLAVARWMVASGARHLALVGRGPLDDARRAAVQALEAAGARLTVRQADVERAADVAALIDELARSMPPLAGVIHAAGVLDDGVLLRQDVARFARVMGPKALGAWNLHVATLGQPLELFAMFSSAASLLGPPGQGNYAAASAFLDALAHHRRALGLPAVAINWGPWAEVGMWAQLGKRAREVPGVGLIAPARGLEAFARIAAGDAAQIAVLPIDWQTFSALGPAGQPQRLLSELLDDAGAARSAGSGDGEERARWLAASAAERPAIVQAFLTHQVAATLWSDPAQLTAEQDLFALGMDSLMVVELTRRIQRGLQLALYPRELYEHPSIGALARYVAAELDRADHLPRAGERGADTSDTSATSVTGTRRFDPPARRLPAIAFVLSSPRAGSTLLRVMLAGHPRLFCPPELHLLGFATLRERQMALGASYLDEGLPRALMELSRQRAEDGRRRAAEWLAEDLTVQGTYERIQELAGARLVVDKSPMYARDLATLERAEQLFDGARYLVLVRHPCAVIESFVRKRMGKLVGAGDIDPHALAERVWRDSYANLLAFSRRVPRDRTHQVRYEELVREPGRVMREVCDFLGVAFAPAVLSPYAGGRMTDGVHAQSVAIGDPDFLAHTAIEATLAERWRDVRLPHLLDEATGRIAAELGYELPAEAAQAARDAAPARADAMPGDAPDTAPGDAPDPAPDPALDPAFDPALDTAPDGAPRESFLDVRGLRLCLLSWGPDDAPLVVYLHGLLDHAGSVDDIARRLVQRGLRVVAPDLRGHGRSGHVGAGGSYHVIDFVADLDALARTLGPAPFTLVGHSFGAGIAGLFAGARSERLSSLVLIEPVAPAATRSDWSSGSSIDPSARLSTHLDYLAETPEHPVLPDLAAATDRLRAATPMPPAQALAAARRLTEPCPGGVRWRWDPRLRTRAGITFHGLELPLERFREVVGRARCPVTVVHGDASDVRKPDRLALGTGRAPDVVLRGGHNLHLDCPSALADVLLGATRPAPGSSMPLAPRPRPLQEAP
ncbi:MAG TPA: alpha/beta fold hydrolase [Kofleriaceae bacterium]|nr:alpha/beta fold hydrolase [Kofleriaceae bacterium]